MTPWMIMMIIAAGPLVALADSFGDDTDEDSEEEVAAVVETEDALPETDGDAPEAAAAPNEQTFTDSDDSFVASDDARQFLEMGAGDDAATGGQTSDIIQGGSGADTISGGAGSDFLYATDANSAGASDTDADVLNGGSGADFLYFGNDDEATGGSGGDSFTLRQDLSGNATITDFDVTADSIVFETEDPETLSVASQVFTDDGVIVTLSNGATLTLQGADDRVSDEQITFEQVLGIAA